MRADEPGVRPAASLPAPSGDEPREARPRTVLVIEDEDDVREPNAEALERAGYRVVQASSWQHALRIVREWRARIDLIVTDLAMPDDAGIAVFTDLRSETGSPPVIVFSAYPTVMRLLDGVLDGVIDWLRKPLDVAAVVDAVTRGMPREEP